MIRAPQFATYPTAPGLHQLPDLEMWPPPSLDKRGHCHGAERGARCFGAVLRYKASAECVRCGRVWAQPVPAAVPVQDVAVVRSGLEKELMAIDAAIAGLAVARAKAQAEYRYAVKQRKRLLEQLTELGVAVEGTA